MLTLVLSILPNSLYAAGHITHLAIQQGVVYFSTSEVKTHTSPNCVLDENSAFWTLSLDDEAGKYAYAMLVSAMGGGMSVSVSSAGDCASTNGYERASHLWLENDTESN